MSEEDKEKDKGEEKEKGGEKEKEGEKEKDNRRVYIGNLAWRVSWQDLKDHFRSIGEPTYAEVFSDSNGRSKGCGVLEFKTNEEAEKAIKELTDSSLKGRKIFVREDRETRAFSFRQGGRPQGRARGRGGYRGGREAGRRGSSSTTTSSRGRYTQRGRGGRGRGSAEAETKPSEPVNSENKGKQLFVGNLPWSTTSDELKELFQQYGEIEKAEVAVSASGRSRGNGIVLFKKEEDAQTALTKVNGMTFKERELYVKEDKYLS